MYKKYFFIIVGVIVLLVGGFYALNAYIRHEELEGGLPDGATYTESETN